MYFIKACEKADDKHTPLFAASPDDFPTQTLLTCSSSFVSVFDFVFCGTERGKRSRHSRRKKTERLKGFKGPDEEQGHLICSVLTKTTLTPVFLMKTLDLNKGPSHIVSVSQLRVRVSVQR